MKRYIHIQHNDFCKAIIIIILITTTTNNLILVHSQ